MLYFLLVRFLQSVRYFAYRLLKVARHRGIHLFFSSLFCCSSIAGTSVDLRDELGWAGHGNFVGAAGSVRTGNCSINSTATGVLYGMPAGSTVAKAHLIWAASNDTPDYDITFAHPSSGRSYDLSAEFGRQYTEDFVYGGETHNYYSGALDVTNEISAIIGTSTGSNETFTLSKLNVDNTGKYCDNGQVFGGFSLIVIFELESEPLRLVNIFEGFDRFWGDSLALTPKNFQVPDGAELPAPGVNRGKHAHITWEGDESNANDGERLLFEGANLTNSNNPAGNQFNSTFSDDTIDVYISSGLDGVDFDIYDITAYVSGGENQVTTDYESGNDLVVLSAEVLSILNVEVADIAISNGNPVKTTMSRGVTDTINVAINNNGPFSSAGELKVTITLDDDLSLPSATFTNNSWACTEVSTNVVECTKTKTFNAADTDSIAIPVLVATNADSDISVRLSIPGNIDIPNVADNHYPIPGGNYDNVISNNNQIINFTVLNGDISTSTKGVHDDNGRIFEPGDLLTYTISIIESAGHSVHGISLVDNISADLTDVSFDFSNLGAEVIDNSTPTQINLSNLSVAAGETLDISYQARIAPSAAIGTTITNIATITDIENNVASPSQSFIVSSFNPTTTDKQLYLYSDNSNEATYMSRQQTYTGNQKYVRVSNGNVSCISNPTSASCAVWPLQTNLVADLNINAVELDLLLRRDSNGTGISTFYLAIVDDNDLVIADGTFSETLPSSPTPYTYALTGSGVVPAGGSIRLIVQNTKLENEGRFRVKPSRGNISAGTLTFSQVRIDTDTVINVDSIAFFDAPHVVGQNSNWENQITHIIPENTIFVRAIVSDPFGTFDITSIDATLTDPIGQVKFQQTNLVTKDNTQVPDLTAAQLMVEFSYDITAADALGTWDVQIRANEGHEGVIWDIDFGQFDVYLPPELTISKQVALASNPSTPISNAKVQDILQYQFEIRNDSLGDAVNMLVNENISPYSSLCFVTDSPVLDTFECTDCADISITTENTEFSDNNDSNFTYLPSLIAAPVTNGRCNFIDNNVTNIQIKLNGTLAPTQSITFTYQVVVN